MNPLVTGLLFGLLFIFSFGPAFFALIQTSMQKGVKPGFFMAVGISLSDAIYVLLAIFGLASFLSDETLKFWVAVAGTCVLLAYAVYSWRKKPTMHESADKRLDKLSTIKYLLKGLILNGLNPFILLFWFSISSMVMVRYDYTFYQQLYFFSGTLITIFTMDLIKVLLAHRLKHIVTPRIVLVLNRSIGIILLIFGLRILYFLFNNYWV